jgi:hypothetical protein
MGASVLAFTVPRRLIIAEGATEAILLPTLLREANSISKLNYQVAPGLANTDPNDYPELATYAGSAVFLVDGDADGARYEQLLLNAGIEPSKVFNLGTLSSEPGLNVEELVAPQVYVEAVNGALTAHHVSPAKLSESDLPTCKWAHFVEGEWCPANGVNPPAKRVVAQRIVDRSRSDPVNGSGTSIVNPGRCATLTALHERATAEFPADQT